MKERIGQRQGIASERRCVTSSLAGGRYWRAGTKRLELEGGVRDP